MTPKKPKMTAAITYSNQCFSWVWKKTRKHNMIGMISNETRYKELRCIEYIIHDLHAINNFLSQCLSGTYQTIKKKGMRQK